MKRSGQVGLVLMGAATFVGTFAAGAAYLAWQKPSHAAQPQAIAPVQNCAPRPDGTQNCEPVRRGFTYYFLPRYSSGWSWGWGNSYEPRRQEAALSSNSRSYSPPPNTGTVRGGFGSTAGSAPFRVSAGG